MSIRLLEFECSKEQNGVSHDKKVHVKLKSKLYKILVRPAIVYGGECLALRIQEEQRLHAT